MSRLGKVVLAAALILPMTASAQLFDSEPTTGKDMQIELKFGPYTPNIDQEGGNSYATIFGKPMFMFRFQYDYQFWQEFGSLAVGFEAGFGTVTGNALLSGSSSTSNDETTLNMVPLALTFSYHLDIFATRWEVPLVPYVKIGIDYNIWWITDGNGKLSRFRDNAKGIEYTGAGDTWGFHVAAGLKILLDTFAPKMAATFDTEIGVNNSYLFAEFFYANINDFGSNTSIDLGTITGLFGLAFEF